MKSYPFTITLAGVSRPIRWDNATLFRADDLGLPALFAAGKFGYSTLCRMVWVMLDDEGRVAYPTPEAVALVLPASKVSDAWTEVMKAYSAGNASTDSEAKKDTGGNAPSPDASSA